VNSYELRNETYERKKSYESKIIGILGGVTATMLVGCAQPPPQQFSMQRPDEQKPQTVTFPNETMFGGASGSQAKYARPARGRLEQ